MIYIVSSLDKIPNGCSKCPYSEIWAHRGSDVIDRRFCTLENRLVEDGRPLWCPLVEIKEK